MVVAGSALPVLPARLRCRNYFKARKGSVAALIRRREGLVNDRGEGIAYAERRQPEQPRQPETHPTGGGAQSLSAIVDQLLFKAEGGDLDAIKIVLDRLEGRPRQSVSLDMGERERYERMVENMIESEAAEGRELSREQAIAALATVSPEIEEVLS